jgi:hypothetical protein
MAKCILLDGQSLMVEFCTMSSGTLTPHPDTHMWNGSGWSAPVGDGAITYANCLREALQEPIYLVNAAVGNTFLIGGYGGDYWANPTGALTGNAIALTQAALASVPGLTLDREEWWQGQNESYTLNGPSPDVMYAAYTNGLQAMLAMKRAALGNDFRFCIWPIGRVHQGATAPVVRAQMGMATASNAPSLGIEPGPASYDRSYRDNVHLNGAGEYRQMGIRAARNAKSYFDAKAAGTHLTMPHDGAGPVIESLLRDTGGQSFTMFMRPRVKTGFGLLPTNVWPNSETTYLNGIIAAWSTGYPLSINCAQLVGAWVKVYASFWFNYPVWMSYQAEQARTSPDACSADNVVYDTNTQWDFRGQPMLPLALGALTSG